MMTQERTAGETFAHLIRLHLDNDEPTYHERRRIVAEAIEDAEANPMTADALGTERAAQLARRSAVADALKEFVGELIYGDPDPAGSDKVTLLAMDLIGAVIGYVDWFDMADDCIAEHDDET